MHRARGLVTIGLVAAFVALLTTPAAAGGSWETIEIQPGDFTECEFEPGVLTRYEVDVATLPRFDQQLTILNELPDGTALGHLLFQRSDVRFLKQGPDSPGPDVLREWQRANLKVVFGSDGQVLRLRGTVTITERTADGRLVDMNHHQLRGLDVDGEPIIVRSSGVCNI